jgi:murein DD-endopeptidase MepM/ murein hydrolase activator NlpD
MSENKKNIGKQTPDATPKTQGGRLQAATRILVQVLLFLPRNLWRILSYFGTSIRSFSFKSFFEKLRHFSARDAVRGIENAWQSIKNLFEKAQHTYYRLNIMNHDTFEEVGSYKLSLLSFYVAVSSLLVGFTILVFMLIAFTPLKRLMPGYIGSGGTDRLVYDMSVRLDSMERALQYQQTYTENFRRLLTNNVQTEEDFPKSKALALSDTNFNVAPTEAENIIRAGANTGFYDETSGTSAANSSDPKAVKLRAKNQKLEQLFLTSPLDGTISQAYNWGSSHLGIDLTAPKNTPVKAIADGFVISSDWTLATGNTIALQHAGGVVSFYKHNSSLLKKVGEKVKTGEAIAIIGNTGEQSSGPHLHFELWNEGKPVNPQEYIRF